MRRRLSSRLTPVFKFGVPGLWLTFAVYSLVDYIFFEQQPALPDNFWAICIFWTLGFLFLLWKFASLKQVYIDNELIYVSNFVKEIEISIASIENIRQTSFWINPPERIILTLRSSSTLGRSVEFATEFFAASKISNELKDRLGW